MKVPDDMIALYSHSLIFFLLASPFFYEQIRILF